jgi:predicted SnoaL-like aldol condensation-catalyzing enzyme
MVALIGGRRFGVLVDLWRLSLAVAGLFLGRASPAREVMTYDFSVERISLPVVGCRRERAKLGHQRESAMLRLFLVATIVALAPAAYAADAQQMEENKKVVLGLYEAAINQKDFEAASKFLGPRYIQHNPRAADGPEGLKAFLAYLREKFPDYHSEIKRVFADGDYVILHVHNVPTPGSRGNAIIDIFRLENGKVVEHWDVRQEIPEQAANSNTMF